MITKWLMALAAAPILLAEPQTEPAAVEKAVLEVSAQMTRAGQDRDADRLFRFIAENDRGSIIQNGNVMITRDQALAQVKANIGQIAKVEYRWKRQWVTVDLASGGTAGVGRRIGRHNRGRPNIHHSSGADAGVYPRRR